MKKVLVILAMVMVVIVTPKISYACWVTDLVVSVPDLVCSSTYEQQQEAAAMVTALVLAKVMGTDAEVVQSALIVLKNGGCFLLSQLKQAFKLVDDANEGTQAKKLKMLRSAPAALPEYPALRKMLK